MKNVIMFDTSIGSLNHGDDIIVESIKREMNEVLFNNYVTYFPTHTPVFHFYQQHKRNNRYLYVKEADYKFICGSNIIHNRMLLPWPTWNINALNCSYAQNSILIGAGSTGFDSNLSINWYSKLLYKKILSKTYIHSVRDSKTKRILNSLGLKAINTGCPTIWGLTKEHCEGIPTGKAKNVIFTLTDYKKEPLADKELISILLRNYENVFFWPQGTEDLNYLSTIVEPKRINIIIPSLIAYSNALHEDVDFIGTRLHAGIYAMQHKKRSIIIKVDNRAEDMKEDYNLNCISRSSISELESMIYKPIQTKVDVDMSDIKKWLSQF